MVGNDIVDLDEAKRTSNWQRPRFLEKVFTSHEQKLIQNSEDSFLMVWRLWSIKEAAYKLFTQLNPSRFYNPKSFECSFQNEYQKVRFKDFECFSNSKITLEYILSEARLKPFEMNSEVIRFKQKNYNSQSEETKIALMNSISKMFNVSISKLKFQKSEFGIPSVSFNSQKINVSISHHGDFGAYTVCNPARFQKPCRYKILI